MGEAGCSNRKDKGWTDVYKWMKDENKDRREEGWKDVKRVKGKG